MPGTAARPAPGACPLTAPPADSGFEAVDERTVLGVVPPGSLGNEDSIRATQPGGGVPPPNPDEGKTVYAPRRDPAGVAVSQTATGPQDSPQLPTPPPGRLSAGPMAALEPTAVLDESELIPLSAAEIAPLTISPKPPVGQGSSPIVGALLSDSAAVRAGVGLVRPSSGDSSSGHMDEKLRDPRRPGQPPSRGERPPAPPSAHPASVPVGGGDAPSGAALSLVDGPPAKAQRGLASPDDGGLPTAPTQVLAINRDSPKASGGASTKIPEGYEFLSELGRGGMGVVLQARDLRLGRVVAIKMLLAGQYATDKDRLRFRREAEAVARISHPNIVQIYQIGEHQGLPYFCLEYCGGGTLSAKLRGRPMVPRVAADLVATIAGAVQAAHAQGVVHRDLKPGNILFTEDGRTPKLTDFGLAKHRDQNDRDGPTRTGQVMGTALYMSPEQAHGAKSVGPAADIYSLGVMLYELLTGRPPFLAENDIAVIYQVLTQEPVPVRQLVPRAPADLETICLKCLQKAPSRRYATAGDLVEDLRRYLRGEPIQARAVGPVERSVKWLRRNPTVATLAGLCGLALATLMVGAVVTSRRMAEANQALRERAGQLETSEAEALKQRDAAQRSAQLVREGLSALTEQKSLAEESAREAKSQSELAQRRQSEAETQRRAAEDNLREAQLNRYLANARLAEQARDEGRFQLAAELLDQMRPQPGETDLRGFEWYHLARQIRRPRLVARGVPTEKNILGVAVQAVYSVDNSWVAVCGTGSTIHIVDAATGEIRRKVNDKSLAMYHLAVSRDGRWLANATNGQPAVGIWDTTTWTQAASFASHGHWVAAVAFSPDGRRLASVGSDKAIRIWSVPDGKLQAQWQVLSFLGTMVAWSPDGRLIAAGGVDVPTPYPTVRVVDSTTGQVVANLEGHSIAVRALAFSADSRHLATGASDGVVRIWQLPAGDLLGTFKAHGGVVTCLRFSDDGRTLLSSGIDGTVRRWATPNGQLLETLADNRSEVLSFDMSPDGQTLVTSCNDGLVRFWPAQTPPAADLTLPTNRIVLACALTPDGQRLITAGAVGGALDTWDTYTGRRLFTMTGHLLLCSSLHVSPNGQAVASAGIMDSKVRFWNTADGSRHGELDTAMTNGVLTARYSPDGRRLAVCGYNEGTKVFDLAAPAQPLWAKRGPLSQALFVAWSPTEERLAVGNLDGRVHIVEAASGQTVHTFQTITGMPVVAIAFSPDGQTLAVSGSDGGLQLLNTQTWKPSESPRAATIFTSLAWSTDGRVLTCGSIDGRLWLCDVPSRTWRAVLKSHDHAVSGMAWRADGRTLVSASLAKTIELARSASEAELFAEAQADVRASPADASNQRRFILAAWSFHLDRLKWADQATAATVLKLALTALASPAVQDAPQPRDELWRTEILKAYTALTR